MTTTSLGLKASPANDWRFTKIKEAASGYDGWWLATQGLTTATGTQRDYLNAIIASKTLREMRALACEALGDPAAAQAIRNAATKPGETKPETIDAFKAIKAAESAFIASWIALHNLEDAVERNRDYLERIMHTGSLRECRALACEALGELVEAAEIRKDTTPETEGLLPFGPGSF